jgi:hypothetical protein
MVFVPINRVDSNSTGAGAADNAGWPENGQDFRLQREPFTEGSFDHFQASQVRSKRRGFPAFEPAISGGTRIATDNPLHPDSSLCSINENCRAPEN